MVFISETENDQTKTQIGTDMVPITEILKNLKISEIESTLLNHLNYAQCRKWIYPPILLFKLLIVYAFRKCSYRRLISSLTVEDCLALGIQEIEPGKFLIPTASNIHDFAYNRVGLDGFKKIMETNGSVACQHIRNGTGMVDSTPIEASRYDKFAVYNPHYKCKMHKMHIFHINQFPLYEIFSEGNDNDAPYAIPLAMAVIQMKPDFKDIKLDGGYDSFNIYADYWNYFRVNPLIDPSDNAVINNEGAIERINHWINKMWKKGGKITDTIENKLKFLYENGRKSQVGMYLRNQNLSNPNFKSEYKSRSDCERTHSHMKHTFNFRVKWVQNRSKEFYMGLNFIAYQTLLLIRLANNEIDIQDLSKYI
jgi:hypothetical protein